MGKHIISKSAVCPFYKYEERQHIYCEGLTEATTIHLAHSTPAASKKHRQCNCYGNYLDCRLAKMLEKKWEDEETTATSSKRKIGGRTL